MKNTDISHKIKLIISNCFEISEKAITDDLEYQSIIEWDSFAHVSLMLALESEFNIIIDHSLVIKLISFEKINNYINNTEFKEFIENTNNEFKSTIAKLLKKYKNKNKFKYIDKNVTTVYNIKTLNTIIQKCIRNEITYEEYNKNITKKIYPYTNFIIAYFAIYLIIINKILANLKII